jgi:hypothetical protein
MRAGLLLQLALYAATAFIPCLTQAYADDELSEWSIYDAEKMYYFLGAGKKPPHNPSTAGLSNSKLVLDASIRGALHLRIEKKGTKDADLSHLFDFLEHFSRDYHINLELFTHFSKTTKDNKDGLVVNLNLTSNLQSCGIFKTYHWDRCYGAGCFTPSPLVENPDYGQYSTMTYAYRVRHYYCGVCRKPFGISSENLEEGVSIRNGLPSEFNCYLPLFSTDLFRKISILWCVHDAYQLIRDRDDSISRKIRNDIEKLYSSISEKECLR